MVRSSGVQMVVNQEGEHSLVLKGVGVADGGIYTCRASNRAGRTTKEVLLVVSAGGWVGVVDLFVYRHLLGFRGSEYINKMNEYVFF